VAWEWGGAYRLVKAASNLACMVSGPWSGQITHHHGARLATIVGATICAGAWALTAIEHGSLGFLVAISIIIVFGQTIILASIDNRRRKQQLAT